jgi:hypothetical protein
MDTASLSLEWTDGYNTDGTICLSDGSDEPSVVKSCKSYGGNAMSIVVLARR